ncbi:hypothetical protein BC629DRAFT_1439530 [Irpex lacteus]|nr:hypothetical protein BC629DRAFT_1439530 [Irpex lacteus]
MNIADVPPDIWFEICLDLSVKSLYMLRATCRGLRRIVDDRSVWFTAFLDLLRVKPSVYSREDLEGMSVFQLREASQRIVQVDRAFSCPTMPHREIQILRSADLSKCTEVALFQGGERILVLRKNGSFDIHDITTGNKVFAIPRIEGLPINECFVRLYPTSIDTGHILVYASVVLAGVEDLWPSRVNAYEFRIYRYTQQDVRHIWTEECSRTMYDGKFAFCQWNDAMTLTQFQPPHKNKRGLLEIHTRTIRGDGRNDKEIFTFYLEASSEGVNQAPMEMTLVSPRYLSYRLENEDEVRLVDMFQARNCANGEPSLLRPIWKSPSQASAGGIALLYPSFVIRSVAGCEPFVRATIWPHLASSAYVLELPALHDIRNPAKDIRYMPIPIVDVTPSDPDMIGYQVQHYSCALFNHGFLCFDVSMLSSSVQVTATHSICPFTIAHSPRSNTPIGDEPGLIRLGREDGHIEILLGNTRDPRTRGDIGQRFMRKHDNGTFMDDISGRFIQLVDLEHAGQRKIMLYTFDHRTLLK